MRRLPQRINSTAPLYFNTFLKSNPVFFSIIQSLFFLICGGVYQAFGIAR
jgi:hypothetical protein